MNVKAIVGGKLIKLKLSAGLARGLEAEQGPADERAGSDRICGGATPRARVAHGPLLPCESFLIFACSSWRRCPTQRTKRRSSGKLCARGYLGRTSAPIRWAS